MPLERSMTKGPDRALSLVVAACLLAGATACGGPTPETPPPAPPPPPAQVQQPPPAPPPPPPPQQPAPTPPAPETEEQRFIRMSLAELNSSQPLQDVFFEYDMAVLSDAARASLQRNAEWMNVAYRRGVRVTIEGHADSRGTNEYNLALGERRAAAVRDYLASLGISADRLSIVSKGEEDPVCRDEMESCWEKNRRGHFVITAK
jgi:peptidoglycan-associated lipoprotein